MNEFKGTPGPWTGLPFHECIAICRQEDADLRLGFISSPNPERMAEGRANAFLIAAAPDLLEALIAMVKEYGQLGAEDLDYSDEVLAARAAIAKALGEAK